MRWLARRTCRKDGHQWHHDPGDFVAYCVRCHDMYDLFNPADMRALARGERPT